jgi:polyferredoxin
MDFGQVTEKSMAMDDQVWAKHANAWSGWTRVPTLPALALSIWARAWIGWWCLLPIIALLIWVWLNPRAFPAPERISNWMSKAVIGERIWLNRKKIPIPKHHARWAIILSALAALGIPPLIWGLWQFDAWAALAGLVVTVGSKLWFLDRMVWLFADMKDAYPQYSKQLQDAA